MPLPATNSSDRHNPFAVISFIAFSLLYLTGVLTIFSPYRFFPSDDLFLHWPFLESDLPSALAQAFHSHQPVFKLTLLAVKVTLALLGQELTPALFLVTSALSDVVIMCSLMLSVHTVNRQGLALPLLAGVAFGLSSWTMTYFFFFSYGPVSSAYCMASISLLLISSRSRRGVQGSYLLCSGAGLLMGLYFWSSPSAPVLAGLAMLLPFLIWQGRLQAKLVAGAIFVASEVLVVVAFGVKAWPALLYHIQENIDANWYYELARANVGTYLEAQKWTPVLSFFQVALKVHAPASAVFFVVAIVLALFSHRASRKDLFAASAATGVGMVLVCYFLAAAMFIDILPTTKLGRSLFQLYPIMLLASFLLITGIVQTAGLSRFGRRLCLGAAFFLLLIGAGADCVKTHDLYLTRFALPRYLEEHFLGKPVYVINEDIHAKWIIASYSPEFDIRMIPLAAVQALVTSSPEEVGILIGPTEKNSSLMSIYLEPPNQDIFLAEILSQAPALGGTVPVLLPFSALHPAFLMENEITQALSLLGLPPNWRSPASGLRLYTIPGTQ